MFVCDNRQKEEIEVRAFLVGRRPCRGVPVDYFLLVEEWDALWECYGIRVESGGERTEIPGITASQSGILSLLSKLMRGSVTPVAARDVVAGAAMGHGHYGWAFWGCIYLLSLPMGLLAERAGRKGVTFASRRGRLLAAGLVLCPLLSAVLAALAKAP